VNRDPWRVVVLQVAISPDAKSWFQTAELEAGRAGLNFGYPTLAQDGSRLIAVYSVLRRSGRVPITLTGIKVGKHTALM
jgi:hypothetical protein